MSQPLDPQPGDRRSITPRTSLDNLKREAKRWLHALDTSDPEARARLDRALPRAPASPTLRDVQHALALEHGLPGWTALLDRLASRKASAHYEAVAAALVRAFQTGDAHALATVWEYFGHRRTLDGMKRYVRLDLGRPEEPPPGADDTITLDEARSLVARAQEFESWSALTAFLASVPRGVTLVSKPLAVYGRSDADASPAILLASRDVDEAIDALDDPSSTGLHAHGQMTDAWLDRVSRHGHLTRLDLNSSPALTDAGIRQLARLPRLTHLNLSGTAVTDEGLEVLTRLPALESLSLAWTRVTDAGLRHLAACDALREVDVNGTAAGDGAIVALAGKSQLCDLRLGHGVTDAGLARLVDLPVFRTWRGGATSMALTSPDAKPNYLLLRGSFSDAGMASLASLDGLFALNLDSDRMQITGAGLAPLAQLPHLAWLAFEAKDESMPYIAALPHLRFLLCQDTTAGDEGFVALGRSQTIEHIWGRRCYNLRRRGFLALAGMPALRHLSVSCRNVDDEGLSALPRFPALCELMPMDVPDEGYRHIAGCAGLESLVLMYCRDTTDAATEHLMPLTKLRKYFASYTRITNRTPEILSGLSSLEEVTLDTCVGVSDDGIATLARLPRLRTLGLSGMPGVTAGIASAFAPGVRVHHSP